MWLSGCADDEEGTEADKIGVAASCEMTEDCPTYEREAMDGGTEEVQLECLPNFKGGYCGIEGCSGDADCPEASRCVAHTDGNNYCFRVCVDKAECNENRGPEEEANCSANIAFVDEGGGKACVPPAA